MRDCCLIFDIGRTNKKVFVLDKLYNVLLTKSVTFPLISDEDGDLVEDLTALTTWVKSTYESLLQEKSFTIKAVNCSSYANALVYLDENKQPISPIYGVSKPFGFKLKKDFRELIGDVYEETGSPNLGILNAGHQFYWLRKNKSEVFKKLKYAVSIPQYIMSLFHGELVHEYTSLGCHSLMWDFKKGSLASWLKTPEFASLIHPVKSSMDYFMQDGIKLGVGIHDNSAALIPYLEREKVPFVLLATGTWTITFNPFEAHSGKISKGRLMYLGPKGNTIIASRLFSGDEHARVVKHLAEHFEKPLEYFKDIKLDPVLLRKLRVQNKQFIPTMTVLDNETDCPFMDRSLNSFSTFEEAYHQFMLDLLSQQIHSIQQTLKGPDVKKIIIDGGFSKNALFVGLLKEAFYDKSVVTSAESMASALGAAMVLGNY